MLVINSKRLVLSQFSLSDSSFIVDLLNQHTFIENIGDKKVRSENDAVKYLLEGPIASYQKHGFGLNKIALKDGSPIGMCGLIKRPELPNVDIGYALMPEYEGVGFATEAARGVLNNGFDVHRMDVIDAVTKTTNNKSSALLIKLGFQFQQTIDFSGEANALYRLTNDKYCRQT